MKTIKWALLGGAALAVSAASAQADDLAVLKAQMEAMQARVNQLEAAPAAPAGTSLITMRRGEATKVMGLAPDKDVGDKAIIFSVLPTADADPVASLEVSGYVRAILGYSDAGGDEDFDVWARGQINVLGKTETAVGEVGGKISIRASNFEGERRLADSDGDSQDVRSNWVRMNEAWGWWQMTPDLNFGGGFTGTLGNVGYGYDGACSCYWVDNSTAFTVFNPGDEEQMRLTWASGPVSFAVALEDGRGDLDDESPTFDEFGAAAKIGYTSDSFSGAISGWYGDDSDYQVSVGIGLGLGDMVALSLAGTMGDRDSTGISDFFAVSGLASMSLTEAVSMELGAAYLDSDENEQFAVSGGFYYQPVSELTMGLEAEYADNDAGDDDLFAGFSTTWRFHE